MLGPRCFLNRCIAARTPLSGNKKQNQQKAFERFLAWKRKSQEYPRPTFNDIPKSNSTSEQVASLEYFENYPIVQKRERSIIKTTPPMRL